MTELTIDRLVTQAAVRGAQDEERVRRVVADLTDRELELALAAVAVPDGLWCLRRLDVGLQLDDRVDSDLGRSWARAVVDALLQDLSDASASSADLVHYARPEQMLADLVVELARGRTERAWAWRTLGAVVAGDPDPDTDARGTVLAALGRRPAAIVAAVADAVAVAGFAPVHGLLGAAGWRHLATGALAVAGEAVAAWLTEDGATPSDPDGSPPAGAVVDHSRIARSWRRSGVRLERDAARTVALLVIAEAEPALLRRPDPSLLRRVVRVIGPRPADAGGGLVVPRDEAPSAPTSPSLRGIADEASGHDADDSPTVEHHVAHGAGTAAARQEEEPPDRAEDGADGGPVAEQHSRLPGTAEEASEAVSTPVPDPQQEVPEPDLSVAADPEQGEPTTLGGLAYLMATAAAADIPDALLTDPSLAHRLPSTLLHQLLVELTGADPLFDDPALRALSGARERPDPDESREVRRVIAGHAHRWRQETADRLGEEHPLEAVRALVRRPGRVVLTPGWVTFELRLADVDLDVRRAGLDLDPGFVPWLGCVVVIRYG